MTADAIVGADGANGITREGRSGSARASATAWRTRATSRYPTLPRERYARRLVLELADIPGGYAWVFPKGDHANVGVGGWQSEGPKLREHLAPGLRGARARPGRPREPSRPPAPAAQAGQQDRGERALARRRRGRADRPGFGRRDVRVLRLLAARRRRRSATCSPGAPRRSSPTGRPSIASSHRSTGPRGRSRRRSTAGRARPGRSRARSSSG